MTLRMGDLEPFGEVQVCRQITITTNRITHATLSGVRIIESGSGLGRILEHVWNAIGDGRPGSDRSASQVGPPHFIPVCGPDIPLEDADGEAGAPASRA